MISQIFEELFGSRARVKILKFFFRNETGYFDLPNIAKRVQERKPVVKKEIGRLKKIGFIHEQKVQKKKK